MTMATSLAGCTFIGLGIGANTDRTRDVQRPLAPGTDLRLELTDGRTVNGKLVWESPGAMAVGSEVVPRTQIRSMRERIGSYALEGLFTGVIIDAAAVLITFLVVRSSIASAVD
jgi:hypothetical protein